MNGTGGRATVATEEFAFADVEPKSAGSRFTIDERRARGKAARAEIPRSAHGEWEPASVRRDPVELLEEQARTRLPELVPIRYGRMLVSPFTFFRGAAYIMAADLANGARTGLHTQLCGDAHLSNFGFFAAPDRRLVFSINDFDETLPGPFEWDVKRLAASFTVAARDLGFDEATRRSVVSATARAYREAMASFAGMRHIDVWYTRLDADMIVKGFSVDLTPRAKRRMEADLREGADEGQRPGPRQALSKRRRGAADRRQPTADHADRGRVAGRRARPPRRVFAACSTPTRSLSPDRRELLAAIATFTPPGRWSVSEASAPAPGSCFSSAATTATRCSCSSRRRSRRCSSRSSARAVSQHGERIVAGQRMMQAAPDIMLGWERIEAIDGETKDFYIRQLWDAKGSAEVELMKPARPRAPTGRSAAGHSPGPTPVRATPSRSPPISARAMRSIRRWWAFARDLRRPERTRLPGTPGRCPNGTDRCP